MTDAQNTEIQMIEDINDATEYQLKHSPNVSIQSSSSGYQISVSIGLQGISHPQTEEHLIEWIALFDGDTCLQKVDFTFEQTPEAVFSVDKTDGLMVRSFCNLHGVFGAPV